MCVGPSNAGGLVWRVGRAGRAGASGRECNRRYRQVDDDNTSPCACCARAWRTPPRAWRGPP